MRILNIAGYKFTPLPDCDLLQKKFLNSCTELELKGTILISVEGINVNLSGSINNILTFKTHLFCDERFSDITFHETYTTNTPFKRLKIKLKKEIITLRKPEINPIVERAPSIKPEVFKKWLDDKHDMTILDTRNEYEVRFGTFSGATHLDLNDFCELPNSLKKIDKQKPLVMFCTGGIRCEKAALYMLSQGYANVYQLEGGILGYFTKVGGAHYQGECFVFDERVAVDAKLQPTCRLLCVICQQSVVGCEVQGGATSITGVLCPSCNVDNG